MRCAISFLISSVESNHLSSYCITVFGSGTVPSDSPIYAAAINLGRQLALAGLRVANGGYGGVMEAVSRGAKEAGGHVTGITTNEFSTQANAWISEEIRLKRWRQRLFRLLEVGHGFVVMPGGIGTLAELSVLLETSRKGIFGKVVRVGDPRPVAVWKDWQAAMESLPQPLSWPAGWQWVENGSEVVAFMRGRLRGI